MTIIKQKLLTVERLAVLEEKTDNLTRDVSQIKESVASYHDDTSARLDTLNTVITESWRDMGSKIDKFKDEVMNDRANVASQLARTVTLDHLEKKANTEDLISLSNRLWGLIVGLGTIFAGFLVWILQELIKKSMK
jgi:CRISPR/Cas system type I-B associated protein Csh2 (Cas7 group RAMP superfamily)